MATPKPEGDVFSAAQNRTRELRELREELDQAKTFLAGVLKLIEARTGDYQKTDRFCLQCHKQYLHSGPDNCQCICHAAVAFMKEHPTQAMIEEAKEKAAALAAQPVDEGQAEDAEQTQT
jgi:hypothetical protein